MRCECLVVTKCCFCLPLRKGLIAWGYFKAMFSIFLMIVFSNYVMMFITYYQAPMAIACSSIAVFFSAADLVMHIMFIVSCHKKNYKYMRWYYRYSVTILSILFSITFGYLFLVLVKTDPRFYLFIFFMPSLIMMIILLIIWICIHFYFIIMVRSEFVKLKNSTQFEFVNCDEEARCNITLPNEVIP